MGMKTLALAALVGLGAGAPAVARAAQGAETGDVVKIVGYLVKLDVAPDGRSAVATLLVKGKRIAIDVVDELTLKKFKIKKIRPDDEIKCQYRPSADGKNLSVSFLRAAGC